MTEQQTTRIVQRAIGSGLVALVGLVALGADVGLLTVTASAMLDIELPASADWSILALMAAATTSSVFFWGMVLLELIGWAPAGFNDWPRGGHRGGWFLALAATMALASVLVIVGAALYRDELLSAVASSGGGPLASLGRTQRFILVGLAAVAVITGFVAGTAIPRLVRMLVAGVLGFAGVLMAVAELVLRVGAGLAGLVSEASTEFFDAVRAEREEWRARREAARRDAVRQERLRDDADFGIPPERRGSVGRRHSAPLGPWRRSGRG